MANQPDFEGTTADDSATDDPNFFAPRSNVSRGFNAYEPRPQSFEQPGQYAHLNSRTDQSHLPSETPSETVNQPTKLGRTRWWWPPSWNSSKPAVAPAALTADSQAPTQAIPRSRFYSGGSPDRQLSQPVAEYPPHGDSQPQVDWGHQYSATPRPPTTLQDENGVVYSPVPAQPSFWEKQPYAAIAHLLALGGTLTFAWCFGILAAQILPGQFEKPPLQESALRKTNRLAGRLWHLPQLWHSPTAETRIEAIPIPETGPVLAAIELSPIERQPLIDELNAIETEVLTLDRRLQALEKRLGKPPYKGADVDHRLSALRTAIDPPVREAIAPHYKPVATHPDDQLLDVAKLKIVLPSDALFTPGRSQLQATELLPRVLDQLVNYPNSTILIRSYSDDRARAIASRQYTLEQANTLASYLQRSLPTKHRWVTLGGGQSQPIVENTDALNRQQNRRIEILVDTRSW
ncbi:MAG: OmpA family protein [Cyanobacteria bacterium J06623_5]